jgi:AhpD family alkylhydroperoxidase
MAPNVPLPRDDELPTEIREMLAALPPLNVFRMMANAPASFRPFLDLAGSILVQAELDARLRELAILRVAHVTGSRYERAQHEQLARNLGVGAEDIAATAVDRPVDGLDEAGNLACLVADEISRDVRLSDGTLQRLLQRHGVRGATELILCVSYFNMLSRFLESTRVELEPEGRLGSRTPADVERDATNTAQPAGTLLDSPRQNGYVVRDIESAMRHWTQTLGVGPFFYVERAPIEDLNYRGAPSAAEVSIALSQWGPLQIELIQQRNDAPSIYRDFIDAGYEGLHHTACWTESMDTELERLSQAGFKVEQSGTVAGGRFVYFESSGPPGSVLELSDVSGGKAQLFAQIAATAKSWDGSDPIRRVG